MARSLSPAATSGSSKVSRNKQCDTAARFLFPAATAFIFSATPAFALESNVTVKSSMAPDAIWKKIGDFCGIKSWIPAVSGCVISSDGKQRTVSLQGGNGQIVERLDDWDDAKRSYTYSIVSGPLPVSSYRSTLSVIPEGKGSAVNWHGAYEAKGTSDADAQKLIDGIYQDGLKGLLGN